MVPLQDKIDSIHESVIRGNMREVRGHLDKRGWANARDHYGHSPLHKSVMANQEDIMKFILRLYPDHIEDRDNVSKVQCVQDQRSLKEIGIIQKLCISDP